MRKIFLTLAAALFAAAGYAQTTYTIAQKGAITAFDVLTAVNGTSYCGTNTPFGTNKPFAPEITGYITDIGTLNAGDKVTIKLANDPASTYFTFISKVPATLQSQNGIDVFTNSISGDNTIVLTRTANAAPAGRMDFTISCAETWIPIEQVGTFSEWWVEGFESVSCRFTNSPKSYFTSIYNSLNHVSVPVSCANSSASSIYLFGVYRTLIADIKAGMTNAQIRADLLSRYPWLGQNFVTYQRIEANPNIIGVETSSYFKFMYDLSADGSLINTSFNNNWSFSLSASNFPFTRVNIPPDLTAATAYIALAPGQYSIVQNSDGSYSIVINYGKLLGDTYAAYPADYAVGDLLPMVAASPAIADLQEQILSVAKAINLAPESSNWRFTIRFADCSAQGQACFTVQSNLLQYGATNSTAVSPQICGTSNPPPSTTSEGQTQITVHYVNRQGLAIANTTSTVGYPADNTVGEAETPAITPAPAALIGYTLVNDPTALAAAAITVGVPDGQILNGKDDPVPYPPRTTVIRHYYFVYEAWTALINPHSQPDR